VGLASVRVLPSAIVGPGRIAPPGRAVTAVAVVGLMIGLAVALSQGHGNWRCTSTVLAWVLVGLALFLAVIATGPADLTHLPVTTCKRAHTCTSTGEILPSG
jgi:hypothetical protein